MTPDALVAELEPYFRSGNEIPVARATIPTDLAERILSALRSQQEEIARLQARIDWLMMEYCPDEMTAEKKANWATHQVAVDEKDLT